MFLKDGNIKEFGYEVSFSDFMNYVDEIREEGVSVDIHSNAISTLVHFDQFDVGILEWKNNKRQLLLEDLTEQVCGIFINMKYITKVVRGIGFYADQFILIVQDNLMYRFIVEC
jgi:hypothetical protein